MYIMAVAYTLESYSFVRLFRFLGDKMCGTIEKDDENRRLGEKGIIEIDENIPDPFVSTQTEPHASTHMKAHGYLHTRDNNIIC